MELEKEAELESNTGSMFFSAVPRIRRRPGSTAAEMTALHMDRTAQLEEMIAKEYAGRELAILGELQPLGKLWSPFEGPNSLPKLKAMRSIHEVVLHRLLVGPELRWLRAMESSSPAPVQL